MPEPTSLRESQLRAEIARRLEQIQWCLDGKADADGRDAWTLSDGALLADELARDLRVLRAQATGHEKDPLG